VSFEQEMKSDCVGGMIRLLELENYYWGRSPCAARTLGGGTLHSSQPFFKNINVSFQIANFWKACFGS
jgi:hypothetical protein